MLNRNQKNKSILVVEDDQANQDTLKKILIREGFTIYTASSGMDALKLLNSTSVDLIVTDLVMDKMSGLELLKTTKKLFPMIDIILMTAHGSIETAVHAMQEGAFNFIVKPFKRHELLLSIEKCIERQQLLFENQQLKSEIESMRKDRRIIGNSQPIQHVIDVVNQVANTTTTILIEGPSGTGKELIAEAIHYKSKRNKQSLVKISCAALPESLLEAELFGYVRGAFTGATTSKEGRFSAANNGTLFLDEIGDISANVQSKLLRVLQEGEFEPLGTSETQKVDVRIVAATNKDLKKLIQENEFREDLYYRLNVIRIDVPPLKDRLQDIPLLLQHFLDKFEHIHGSHWEISQNAMDALCNYHWPGNIRELENTIERAMVLSKNKIIDTLNLPSEIKSDSPTRRFVRIALGTPLKDIEYQILTETLKITNGDKALAAHMLGIAERTIYRKLKDLH